MIGLALGGGGMKGLAHVGALSVIEQCGVKPDIIAGTSIGALVGALYAAGMPTASMQQLFADEKIVELIQPRFDGKGLMNANGLRELLELFLPIKEFSKLKTPFMAIACNIETGAEVVIREGSVVDAVLASTAIPGFFAPVQIGNQWMVDGGILNNLPLSALKQAGATKSLAIQLFNETKWSIQLSNQEQGLGEATLTQSIANFMLRFAPTGFKVLERALDVMIANNERLHLALHPPDVLISPDVSDISIIGFHEARDPIFQRGVEAAKIQSAAIKALLSP